MKCPIDDETLVMTDRNGVEIDYCPKCRGVWLDRGELDKIIERSAGAQPAPGQVRSQASGPMPQQPAQYDHKPYKKKKKESFLEELFDF